VTKHSRAPGAIEDLVWAKEVNAKRGENGRRELTKKRFRENKGKKAVGTFLQRTQHPMLQLSIELLPRRGNT